MHETELTQEQIEAVKLREKYTPKPMTPLERAKQLDKLATAKARTAAIAFGCLGTLVFGTGMSCVLAWHASLMHYGIMVGCIGAVMCVLTPFLHHRMKTAEMQKIAPQVLELTKDI
ncbi:MAG: hypothetical protein IJZ68_07825 [Bacteroidaceae bacterium]|nr:hypothetical protein [Bacteroidaceae bacterium]